MAEFKIFPTIKFHKSVDVFIEKFRIMNPEIFETNCIKTKNYLIIKKLFRLFHLPCKKILQILEYYKIRNLEISTSPYDIYDGSYYFHGQKIKINILRSSRTVINTIFHELGHHYCYVNGIYNGYHIKKSDKYWTRKEKIKYIQQAYKAEKWVENWAEVEQKKYFPKVKFDNNFKSKKFNLLTFKKQYTNRYRKQLKTKIK